MKKLIIGIIAVLFLSGCAGMTLSDHLGAMGSGLKTLDFMGVFDDPNDSQ